MIVFIGLLLSMIMLELKFCLYPLMRVLNSYDFWQESCRTLHD